MSLDEYRRKRQFTATREPTPEEPVDSGRARFVVQLHHARSRHYDFRLQVGNALRSWAVPKGPSLDPAVKRLAAEVEDHPLAYAEFEGEIPRGQYGAGHIALFDRGVWSTDGDPEEQLAQGHLRFELFGHRLKGGWHLVRTHRNAPRSQWLLFKADDPFAAKRDADDMLAAPSGGPASTRPVRKTPRNMQARPGDEPSAPVDGSSRVWALQALALPAARKQPLPTTAVSVQLARQCNRPPKGDRWVHELKWDGYRMVAVREETSVRLWSRNGIEWTEKFPDVVAALARLPIHNGVFDGEVIAGSGARETFSLLQSALAGTRAASLTYVLFDVLFVDDVDVRDAPLLDRKRLLAAILADPPSHLAYSTHGGGDGGTALEVATRQGYEGIVSKRSDQPYRAGRSDVWCKIKRVDSAEFAVVGYTTPKGSRHGFGALLLASPDPEHRWRYAGKVGSGFTDGQLQELGRQLDGATRSAPSVHVDAPETGFANAHWFSPRFVVEVMTRGQSAQGLLRQPSFKAVRADKGIQDLVAESATHPAAEAVMTSEAHTSAPRGRKAPRITHPGRLVFVDQGITKQEVADYYDAVSEYLLLEIQGRPLSVVRCPEGTAGNCFFQKHRSPGMGGVGKVTLKGNAEEFLVVRDAIDLATLVQFNAIEFHSWGARAAAPDTADRVVFDLDPGPGVEWAAVKRAARQVRSLLDHLGLQSFLRTSGGKGLHVVVPLNPGCAWPLVKRFAKGFADALAGSDPTHYVAVATKALRTKRIFIDYLRNGQGATSVASYSLRARAGAPVATPIAWRELGRLRAADAYTLRSLPRRLASLQADPWGDIDRVTQDLSRWSEQVDAEAKMS